MFSLFGMLMAMNIVHEVSHKEDLKDLVVNGEICALVIPDNVKPQNFLKQPIAFYSYDYYGADNGKYDKIRQYTEYKAYALGTFVAILFLASFFYYLYHGRFTKVKN